MVISLDELLGLYLVTLSRAAPPSGTSRRRESVPRGFGANIHVCDDPGKGDQIQALQPVVTAALDHNAFRKLRWSSVTKALVLGRPSNRYAGLERMLK
jgi:hypothetical protein